MCDILAAMTAKELMYLGAGMIVGGYIGYSFGCWLGRLINEYRENSKSKSGTK